jgi:hypothetical protein
MARMLRRARFRVFAWANMARRAAHLFVSASLLRLRPLIRMNFKSRLFSGGKRRELITQHHGRKLTSKARSRLETGVALMHAFSFPITGVYPKVEQGAQPKFAFVFFLKAGGERLGALHLCAVGLTRPRRHRKGGRSAPVSGRRRCSVPVSNSTSDHT